MLSLDRRSMKKIGKAIILSAGQGSRLLPLTASTPKCLLPLLDDMTALGWQLSQLEQAGFEEAVVVTGFQSEKVERELTRHSMPTRTIYNPFYKVADNLGSVWMARQELSGDCVLINGDTLFTSAVAVGAMRQAREAVTVTVARKSHYDADDMKVVESGGLLQSIGKTLTGSSVNAESIGFIVFGDGGAETFRAKVEQRMRSQEALGQFYLSVIGGLAGHAKVGIAEVPGDQWCETDFPLDLVRAREMMVVWTGQDEKPHVRVAKSGTV